MSTSYAKVRLFGTALRSHMSAAPNALALRMPEGDCTYGELSAIVSNIAARLQASGCVPGDRIAILAHASLKALEIMVGTVLARCATVPLSTSVSRETLAGLIADCRPRFLFAEAEYLPPVGIECGTIILISGEPPSGMNVLSLKEWLAGETPPLTDTEEQASDLFSIIYSSGTTGVPKGIAHSNGVRSSFYTDMSINWGGLGSRNLVTTALYTNASFNHYMSMFYIGGAAIGTRNGSAESFIDHVICDKITHCFLVPVQVRRIMDSPKFDPDAMNSLRVTMVSGSVCDLDTKKRLAELWPGDVIEVYGMTEGGAATGHSLKNERVEKLGTVGAIAANSEIVILDDEGRPLPMGEPGEIAGFSNQLMEGYFNRPDLTDAITWSAPDGRKFLKTGDIGFLDENGYLSVTDRKKDMIISGGVNIYASDIEAVFEEREDVAETAVIAIPSSQWGETPYAIVVPAAGAKIDREELLQWANVRLGKMSRLNGLELRSGLPRNQMGKVVKRELREPFWKGRAAKIA